MSREAIEMVELEMKTVADDYRDPEQPQITASLPYQKVVGLSINAGGAGSVLTLPNPNGGEESDRRLQVPPGFATDLFKNARNLAQFRGMSNCHSFSRSMINFQGGDWTEDWQPITQTVEDGSEVERLPLGAMGLVAVTTPTGLEVVHSAIGLGEDEPDSIQVLSTESELGIVANEAVIEFYRQYYDTPDVGLYAVAEDEVARLQEEALGRFEIAQSLDRMSVAPQA